MKSESYRHMTVRQEQKILMYTPNMNYVTVAEEDYTENAVNFDSKQNSQANLLNTACTYIIQRRSLNKWCNFPY